MTEFNCKYVVSEMFDFFTLVSEIFGFPVCGKCYSGLLFEYIYYIVEYMFVWYTNYSVL